MSSSVFREWNTCDKHIILVSMSFILIVRKQSVGAKKFAQLQHPDVLNGCVTDLLERGYKQKFCMHFVFGALKSQDRRSHGAYAKELPNCYIAYIHGISTSRNNRSDNFNCPRQQLSKKKKKKKPQLTWTKIVLTMEHRQGLSVCSRLAKI